MGSTTMLLGEWSLNELSHIKSPSVRMGVETGIATGIGGVSSSSYHQLRHSSSHHLGSLYAHGQVDRSPQAINDDVCK